MAISLLYFLNIKINACIIRYSLCYYYHWILYPSLIIRIGARILAS